MVPIIDVIDDKTMEYYHGNGNYFQVYQTFILIHMIIDTRVANMSNIKVHNPIGCSVTQLVVSWLAVRPARVRISARHPYGGSAH